MPVPRGRRLRADRERAWAPGAVEIDSGVCVTAHAALSRGRGRQQREAWRRRAGIRDMAPSTATSWRRLATPLPVASKALGSEALRHHLSMALPNKSSVRTCLLSQATRWAAPTAQGRTVRQSSLPCSLTEPARPGIPMSDHRHGTQLFQIASRRPNTDPHITSLECRPG